MCSTLYSCEEGVLEIPRKKSVTVKIDGILEKGEYPVRYENPGKGITIHWIHDDSLIYVALESFHKGWVGISFGTTNINNSSMIMFYCNMNKVVMKEQKWISRFLKFFSRKTEDYEILESGGIEYEGRMIIEFSMPVISKKNHFLFDKKYGFVLAYHKNSRDFTEKPTGYSTAQFVLCSVLDSDGHHNK
jgi:hypothetical protein